MKNCYVLLKKMNIEEHAAKGAANHGTPDDVVERPSSVGNALSNAFEVTRAETVAKSQNEGSAMYGMHYNVGADKVEIEHADLVRRHVRNETTSSFVVDEKSTLQSKPLRYTNEYFLYVCGLTAIFSRFFSQFTAGWSS